MQMLPLLMFVATSAMGWGIFSCGFYFDFSYIFYFVVHWLAT